MQIDNLTSGRNYTVLFQSGQNAISTYASNLSMILDGRYQTMADFLTAIRSFAVQKMISCCPTRRRVLTGISRS